MELYSWEGRERPAVLSLLVEKTFDRWTVAGVFNWNEGATEQPVKFADLGLPSGDGRKYHVYEFWGQKYLGEHEFAVTCDLPMRSCKLLSIHEAALTDYAGFVLDQRRERVGSTCSR